MSLPSRRWPLSRLHHWLKVTLWLTGLWLLLVEPVALGLIRRVPLDNLLTGSALNALWLLPTGWLALRSQSVMTRFNVAAVWMIAAGFAARALFYGWSTVWLYGVELILLSMACYLLLIYLWAMPPAWQTGKQ